MPEPRVLVGGREEKDVVGLADTAGAPLRRLGVRQVDDKAMRFLQSVEPALEYARRPRCGVVRIHQARRAVARQGVDQFVREVDDWQSGVDGTIAMVRVSGRRARRWPSRSLATSVSTTPRSTSG